MTRNYSGLRLSGEFETVVYEYVDVCMYVCMYNTGIGFRDPTLRPSSLSSKCYNELIHCFGRQHETSEIRTCIKLARQIRHADFCLILSLVPILLSALSVTIRALPKTIGYLFYVSNACFAN